MKYLYTLLFLILAVGAYASKAVISPRVVTLDDGSTRVVTLRGDEHFSFFASSQGELVIRQSDTWRLATEQEIAQAKARLTEVNAQRERLGKANASIIATRPFPCTGNPKALVILVSFTDRDFEYSAEEVENLFAGTEYNGESGMQSYGSLAQYMDFCSDGQFVPEFDFAGPYELNGTVKSYGYNSGGSDANTAQFVKDACAAADSDGVDFSQYDADGDGYVDLVYIVYAGFGENWGDNSEDCLWPKSGTGDYGTYDGVKVNRYGINQELIGYDELVNSTTGKHYLNGIGVLAHEFCHTMGLFDVYPTADWSDVSWYDNQSMEIWSLMDYGENNYNGYYPTPLTAWERELFGWINIEPLDSPANITLTPLQDGGKAYRIVNDNDATGNEYYILESIPNGSGTGFYRRMPGNGMVVTHVNYDRDYFSNFANPNNVQGEPRLTIVPADGILMSSYRVSLVEDDPLYITTSDYYADHAGDPYPGTSEITSLTDYKAYTGTVEKPITDITQDGFAVSFAFMGGAEEDGITDINADNAFSDGATYNLQGQRVNGAYRGVMISNGRKYVRK